MKSVAAVVAFNPKTMGIGLNGQIPWVLREDMAFFKEITSKTLLSGKVNAVIMGRKTWESIPSKFKPLPGRKNIVLSRDENIRERLALPAEVLTAGSLVQAVETLSKDDSVDKLFVIGGESIYNEAVKSDFCHKIYATEVYGEYPNLDTFFPIIPATKYTLKYRSTKQTNGTGISYAFTEYDSLPNDGEEYPLPPAAPITITTTTTTTTTTDSTSTVVNAEEMQYLNLVREIIETGVLRGDRTGTGTISKFGVQMRFSLRNQTFPLITTKRVFWRGVAEELLWFIEGCTNANKLKEKDIHIWDGNGSREFLDKLGLVDREEGDLGPVYGFQWRHFGAKYTNMHADYTNKGIDQLKECIHKIIHHPEDRRIVMTAWNPSDLSAMALPPCHMFCQFYVANGELSCHMYQRSADMGLGVPFNIASYALLTCLMAQVCGLTPGDFVHSIGDAHVYVNHIDALKIQIAREPKVFPKLHINPDVKDIDSFTYADLKIEGYQPDAAIKMTMAV